MDVVSVSSAKPASEQDLLVEVGGNQGLSFSVRRVPNLILNTPGMSTSTASTYELCGPPEAVSAVSACVATKLRGMIGSMHPVTLKGAAAEAAGVPHGAKYFAFLHPLEVAGGDLEPLMKRAMVNPDAPLPAWLDLVLVGGFCYFDEQRTLVRGNALSLNLTQKQAEPEAELDFHGPHAAPLDALEPLEKAGRLGPITIPSLLELGFEKFGWVHPGETSEGRALPGMEHGGFIYHCVGSDHSFYYGVHPQGGTAPETPQRSATAARQAKELHRGLSSARQGLSKMAGGVAASKHLLQKQIAKMTPAHIATVDELIKKYDVNCDGTIDRDELMAIFVDLREGKKELGLMKKVLCLLIFITILLCGALFGTSFAAGVALKESHISNGVMTTLDGDTVRTNSAEFNEGLFALPDAEGETLSELTRLDFVIDARGVSDGPFVTGGVLSSSFSVTSWVKDATAGSLYLYTASGAMVSIHGKNATASILTGGTTYPIFESFDDIEGLVADFDGSTSETPSSRRALSDVREGEEAANKVYKSSGGAKLKGCGSGMKEVCLASYPKPICFCRPDPSKQGNDCVPGDTKTQGGDKYKACPKWHGDGNNDKKYCYESNRKIGFDMVDPAGKNWNGGSFQSFMFANCKCTCRKAKASSSSSSGSTTVVTEPACTKNEYPLDKNSNCAAWKDKGYCSASDKQLSTGQTYESWMLQNCKCSCNQELVTCKRLNNCPWHGVTNPTNTGGQKYRYS